ncbi:hypothetical protein B0A48_18332 [Cryoendolithus antarcticus]|uniref:Uncharacterized protein n=1 Tax=Cryoendolithus antarcticus TaxID=1507870 RepID=A0A1V8S8I4_9PEZI|nr:hypothetical protein B0A48_18332 [Cryoendolithus antarcticus]
MADRNALTSRQIPSMTLSDGSDSSLTAPPPPLPHYLTPEGRAIARFAVEGCCVVTGGAGTLGLSAARALLEHGASGVALWDLPATLQSSKSAIDELNDSSEQSPVIVVPVDVADQGSVTAGLHETLEVFETVDHLFCFAGIVGCVPALTMTAEQFRKTLNVNITGSFLTAQAIAQHMASNPAPNRSVTLTASISAHRVNYPQPQAAYNVSKAAVVALKSSLAAEWAHAGIRVNSISPGYMDTILNAGEGSIEEMRKVWASRNPMGRMGAVGELDGVCVLLASRAGTYINGADFVIDGGATLF